MRCIICDHSEWENVDEFRYKPHDMSICTHCGFVSYPKAYMTKEKVIEYYRKDYRPAPTVENLYQGQRKLHYHHEFLWPTVLKKWKDEGKEDPVVFELGSAYGLVLQWIKTFSMEGKQLFPKADVAGTELTETYKRNAYYEYGINLQDDFDESKKYDLIMSYKVAEHMFDIDVEMKRYHKCLKPDGKLYISVPTWFNKLNNFGGNGFSLEYYYAKPHVNVWTRQHFEALLKKCGFKIVERNHCFYDDTYLCEVDKNAKEEIKVDLPNVSQIKDFMHRIKQADILCNKKDFEGAIHLWPNFPIARRALYEYKRKEWHKEGVDAIIKNLIDPWLKIDPLSVDAHILWADLLMRYNKHKKALPILEKTLQLKPKCEHSLTGIVNCFRVLANNEKDERKRVEHLLQARQIAQFLKNSCLSSFAAATTLLYTINAEIPLPKESKDGNKT